MKITILGGTGYAGSHIAAQAVAQGHDVSVVARKVPQNPLDKVVYRTGDITDTASSVSELLGNVDVIVSALSPRGPMEGKVLPAVQKVAAWASQIDARLIVIGGYSTLRLTAGGTRISRMGRMAASIQNEVDELADIVDWLEDSSPTGLNWLYVSPGQGFGPWNEDEPTGRYDISGDVSPGRGTTITVQDFALGVVDEIASSKHSGHILIREVR